jgi:hypothetical protein
MLDGAGLYIGLAVVLFVFALIVVFLELQSPDLVQWTGHRVTGTEQGGIVFYQWHGQSYSLDAPGYGSSKAIAVYLDPANPDNAMINDWADRVFVALLIGAPIVGGVLLLVAGLTRNYRWRRRRMRRGRRAGDLLDTEVAAQHLRELRRERGSGP